MLPLAKPSCWQDLSASALPGLGFSPLLKSRTSPTAPQAVGGLPAPRFPLHSRQDLQSRLVQSMPPGIMLGKPSVGLWEVDVPIREADHISPLPRKCVGFDTQTPLSCVTMLSLSHLLVVEIMWWKIIKYKGKNSICLPMISIIQWRRRWEFPHFIHLRK